MKFERYNHEIHLRLLYQFMMDPEQQYLFLNHKSCNSLKEFDGWLDGLFRSFYHEFFLIKDDKNDVAGMIYSYKYSPENGHCHVSVYIPPEYQGSGLGAFAGLRFLDYLFRNYSLRRVQTEVYAYNTQSLESQKRCGFEETGRIPEYRYYNGTYHDLILLSVGRDDFYKKCGIFLKE